MIQITNEDNSKRDYLTEEDLEEILELKKELNEKMDYFNKNASPKSIEKAKKFNKKMNNKSSKIHNLEKEFPNMNKKERDKTVKKLISYNKRLDNINKVIDALQRKVDIDPGRLIGLTDGIFSIVMTLLIFGMTLPEIQFLTAKDFSAFIISMLPNIGVTLISFILLASFWISHHQFIKIKSLNMPFLWLNILFLATISFIPFTTTLIGTYSKFILANLLFGFNILLSLILFVLIFKYADKMKFLENEISYVEKQYTYNTFYMIMGITALIIILIYYVSQTCIYLFLLIPIISVIRNTIYKIKQIYSDNPQ